MFKPIEGLASGEGADTDNNVDTIFDIQVRKYLVGNVLDADREIVYDRYNTERQVRACRIGYRECRSMVRLLAILNLLLESS